MNWEGSKSRTIKQKVIIFFGVWVFGISVIVVSELFGLGEHIRVSYKGPLPIEQLPNILPRVVKFTAIIAFLVVLFDSIGRKNSNKEPPTS